YSWVRLGVSAREVRRPGKESTGDVQEGVWPPRDYSLADRVLHSDTLDDRLRAERRDRVRADDPPALLIDDQPETGDGMDAELSDDEVFPAAEEAAVHVVEEPPGAVDRDVDSYTGEKL